MYTKKEGKSSIIQCYYFTIKLMEMIKFAKIIDYIQNFAYKDDVFMLLKLQNGYFNLKNEPILVVATSILTSSPSFMPSRSIVCVI